MAHPVKWFHQEMQGAPTFSSAAGGLITWLDALLIDGFNLLTVDSLTYDGISGEATATIAGGHGYLLDQIVLIAGADQPEYNGEQRVTYIDSTTFRYAPASAPGGNATGTLSAKTAPVGGWEKAFDDGAGTKAAYRSTDPLGTGLYLRIDDSNTVAGWNESSSTHARMFGCYSMTDIDSYSGQWENGDTWVRKQGSFAVGDTWWLVGDSRLFYWGIFVPFSNALVPETTSGYCFGDFVSYRPGDTYNAMLAGIDNIFDPKNTSFFGSLSSSSRKAVAANYGQLPGAVGMSMSYSGISSHLGYGGLAFPNGPDAGLYFHHPLLVREGSHVRGEVPGLVQCLHTHPLDDYTILLDVGGVVGRSYMGFPCAPTGGYTESGQAWFDIVGPWR